MVSPGLVHANAVFGSAYAAHATLVRAAVGRAVRLAIEEGSRGGGRPAAGRADDGALARGHAVHVRPDHGSGWYTDGGNYALHAGPDQQAVDQVQDRRTHPGRLRQGHVRSGNGPRLHKRLVIRIIIWVLWFYRTTILIAYILYTHLNR